MAVAVGEAITPVPLTAITCGLFAAESVSVTEPLREPASCGANAMPIVQVPFAAIVCVH